MTSSQLFVGVYTIYLTKYSAISYFLARFMMVPFLSLILSSRPNANVDFRYTDDDPVPKPTTTSLEVKAEPVAATEVKMEDSAERNGDGDQQMHNGEQDDDDDEIDFNLGNASGGGDSYDAPSTHEAHGPGIKEDG
jgi:hypothetical protein